MLLERHQELREKRPQCANCGLPKEADVHIIFHYDYEDGRTSLSLCGLCLERLTKLVYVLANNRDVKSLEG